MLSFTTFAIVCPLCLVAGFVDSIAGGGGLISIPAFLFAGLPVHATLATNKLQSTLGTAVATLKYLREGFMVPAFCAAGVACGLAGSALGSSLALVTDDFVFRVIMLAVLPVVAFHVLRTKDLGAHDADPLPRGRAIAVTAAVALAVGVYDGFYGPGTGTFLMLLLTGVAHQSLQQAAGTTKAINLSTNLASLVVFWANGAVLVPLGLAAAAFNMAGNWLGARFFTERGSSITRPIMLAVIVLFAAKLLADIVPPLLAACGW